MLCCQRSHAFNNFCAVRSIYDGLTHPCLENLSETRLVRLSLLILVGVLGN